MNAITTVYDAVPAMTSGVAVQTFSHDWPPAERRRWLLASPVWPRLAAALGLAGEPEHLAFRGTRSEAGDLCDADEMEAAGLPLGVYVGGDEWTAGQWLAVNEDGTRGAILLGESDAMRANVDPDAAALGVVRRDQGYGPGSEFPG
jgi:hypothetical protein